MNNKIISVCSGKGGTGKTNITLNLAYLISQKYNKKVLVFDADFGLNNIDIYLDLNIEKTIEKYLNNEIQFKDLIYQHKQNKNLHIISGSSGNTEVANISSDKDKIRKIVEEIKKIKKEFDFIFIDNSPGLLNSVIELSLISDYTIVVSNSEHASVIDAYQFIKELLKLNYYSKNIYVLSNKVENFREGKEVYDTINMVIKEFLKKEVKFLGSITNSKVFKKSLLKQKLVIEINKNYESQFNIISLKLIGK